MLYGATERTLQEIKSILSGGDPDSLPSQLGGRLNGATEKTLLEIAEILKNRPGGGWVEIDQTLTQPGKAADAQVTGRRIAGLESVLGNRYLAQINDPSDLRTDRKLLWNDEFEFIDQEKWAVTGDFKFDWSKSWYCGDSETIQCKDSVLTLTGYKVDDTKVKCPLLISRYGFRGGLIEVRVKFDNYKYPMIGGVWSTTLPPRPDERKVSHWDGTEGVRGEIDICEPHPWSMNGGTNCDKFGATLHYFNSNGNDVIPSSYIYSVDDAWHIYGLEILDGNTVRLYKDRNLIGGQIKIDNLPYYGGVNVFKEFGLYPILNWMFPDGQFDISKLDAEKFSYCIDWIRVYAPEGKEVRNATYMVYMDNSGEEYAFSAQSQTGEYTPKFPGVINERMNFSHKFYPEEAVIMPRILGYQSSKTNLIIVGAGKIWSFDDKPYRLTTMTDIGDFSMDVTFDNNNIDLPDGMIVKKAMTSDGNPIVLEPNGELVDLGEAQAITLVPFEAVPIDQYPPEYREIITQILANVVCKYTVKFTSGATPTVLTVVGAKNTFVPEANKSYLLTITDGFVRAIST